MNEVKIKINGTEICTQENQTILEVARENEIEIPNLCYDENLKPIGSCGICLVKINEKNELVKSCSTEIFDGMEVEIDNEEIRLARKNALELLLSDHYADCIAPCKIDCPAGIDVQGFLTLIKNGLHQKAAELIIDKLPLPLSIGRICSAFCEEECRRQIIDDSISIRKIVKFVTEKYFEDAENVTIQKTEIDSDKRVAIIGAGPSGLTAAYYLTKNGHNCTIYEALPQSGGMLKYGIPEYKLPKNILDKEIEHIKNLGVKIRNDVKLGYDFTLQFLEKEFDAIFLALGTQSEMRKNLEGENLSGCYNGIDFLKKVTEKKISKIGKIVTVLGGGDTAIDVARTSLRLGAKKVMIFFRKVEKDFSASKTEIQLAKDEGIEFCFLQNPTKILGKNGKVSGLQCVKMHLADTENDDRQKLVEVENSGFILKTDNVILASKRIGNTKFLLNETSKINSKNVNLTELGLIKVNPKTGQTNIPKIFSGGDVVRGPSTVVEAIVDGQIVANGIHKFLTGNEISELDFKNKFTFRKAKTISEIDSKEFEKYKKMPRIIPEIANPKTRIKNFEEIEKVYSDEDAQNEAERCIECGCSANQTCKLRKYATDFNIDFTKFLGGKFKFSVDDNHPFILRDPNKCISCGKCVKICSEIQGVGAIQYIADEANNKITPKFEEFLLENSCESCGKCLDVCPTGALFSPNMNLRAASLKCHEIATTCGFCGSGCQINYTNFDDKIKIATPKNNSITDGNICFDGRFGYEILQKNRLIEPHIRTENDIQKCNWDEMFGMLSEKLPNLALNCAIFANGSFTNEEFFLINQIAKKFNIQKKFSWELNNSAVKEKLGINFSPNPISDLLETDLIVLIGNVSHTLGIKIIEAVRNGKKLLNITSQKNKFSNIADFNIESDDYINIFNQFAKYFIENRCHNVDSIVKSVENFVEFNHRLNFSVHQDEFYEFADILVNNKKVIFAYSEFDLDFNEQLSILNLCVLKENLGEVGTGIITSSKLANKATLQHFGFTPIKNIANLNSAIIFGENPLFDNQFDKYNWLHQLDFLVVGDCFMTEAAKMANVVIPFSNFLETDGTFVNENNVFQKVNKIVNPPAKWENWQIFSKILDIQKDFAEISQNANSHKSEDDSKENRFILDEAKGKINMQFESEKSLFKTSENYNISKQIIKNFKKNKLNLT